jgi:hypothetical protein
MNTFIDPLQTLHIIEVLEDFLERRPPVEIRSQLDIGYKIQDQSIFMLEIRPSYTDPDRILEHEIAKATYVKSKDLWKIFWLRADLKWHSYEPCPTVKTVEEFVELVGKDSLNCFWG